MDSDLPDIQISDVVMSTAGRDQGEWFYVIDADPVYLFLANGKDRTIEKPTGTKESPITISHCFTFSGTTVNISANGGSIITDA